MAKARRKSIATRTPLKAIRAKCMNCSGNQLGELWNCPVVDCPLYEYRTGHRPLADDEDEKTLLQEGFSEKEGEGDKSIEEDTADEKDPS